MTDRVRLTLVGLANAFALLGACGRDAVEANPLTTGQLDAIREMKARDRKRRRARDRYRAMRDLGMVKTPYGWE